nr:signal transducer and activator of transcription 1-like protein [Epinephelus akaara]
MAQWQDLLRLDSALQGRVSQLYDEKKFPREIRHYLCVLIESQNWDLAAVDENTASTCFYALLLCLDEQWGRSVQENNILQGPDFPGMKDYLLKHFGGEPLKLAVVLSECLKEEKKILASASEAQGCNSPAVDQKWRELDNKVNELKQKTAEVKKEMKSLEFLNENIDFIQKTWQSQVEQNIGLAQSQAFVEGECLKRTNRITQTKQMVLEQIVNILKLAQEVVLTLTDVELPEWKSRQQMACIGSPVDTCLDHLQKWFTTVAEVLLQVREQLQKLQDQNKKYSNTDDSSPTGPVAEIENFTLSLFKKLLQNALVVEKQPIMSSLPHRPLILKTRVRFTVSVRFLANLPEFKCLLKVKPVFDMDVEEAKTVKGFRHFDFNSDDGKVLDVDTPHGGLVAEFGHMSLKESKAKSKGSNESLTVTEELHIIKFVTVFQHAGLEFDIEASSLPVVVISSTNQVVSAWASVMWWNMLSTSEPRNLSLFIDPPPLAWQQLSRVLSWQFLSVGQRELDEYQLSMLSDRIVDDPDGLVYWSKFSKNENAWIWIDGILDLIKKHLVDLWRDGFIMGFVSRERTRLLLQEKQAGTFLLRFSESSKDGAITFSWVERSKGETHVHAVEPYTKMELLNMSLPNIIYNYSLRAQKSMHSPLLYLYPDIPKDTAFGRYYNINHETSAPKKVVHPYVHRTLVPVSENPTPPPSPPGEMVIMDVDVDTRLEEHHQELFSDLLNLPELPDLMNYQDMALSQTNFVDLYNTF